MNIKTIHFYDNHDENNNNETIRVTHKQRIMDMNQLKLRMFTFLATLEETKVSVRCTVSDGLIAVHGSGPKHTLLTPRYQNVLLHPTIITVIHKTYHYDV
jgi:predicted DNA binding CopG/RHH family protein